MPFQRFLALVIVIVLSGCTMKHSKKNLIDLTHAFDEHTIYWPTEEGFVHEKEFFGLTDKGYFYSSFRLCTAEHGGTHIDAPLHFNEKGQSLDQIPLERLIGPGALIDIGHKCRKDSDYQVSIADLKAWEEKHKESLEDKIVLLHTGFSRFWPDRARYLGTDEKGAAALKQLHFPGLDPDAAHFLANERRIRAVGIDTASIDHGQSSHFGAHRALFAAQIPAFENVADLDRLPPVGFEVLALPMKIKNGSGGPLRIIARVQAQ